MSNESSERMKCRLCHRGANEINGYLHRVNEKGVIGIWECRPSCNTDISPEDAIMQAITGGPEKDTELGWLVKHKGIDLCGVSNPGGVPCTKPQGHPEEHDPAAYGPKTPAYPAGADAQREPELSNAEIARQLTQEWAAGILDRYGVDPLEGFVAKRLITAITAALDAKDTRSRPTVAEIRRQAFDEAIAIIVAKRDDEWQKRKSEEARCSPSEPTVEYFMCRDQIIAANEIIAQLTAARDAAPTDPEKDSEDESLHF